MSKTIKWVKGDTKPAINVDLKDDETGDPADPDSWDPIDVSAGTTIVTMVFRKIGDSTIIDTIVFTKISGGAGGKIFLKLTATAAGVSAGLYEGEIIIDYNGETQTVYDKLRFSFRE